MNCELALSPAGHLFLHTTDDDGDVKPDAWTRRVAAAFSLSQAAGLFALAARRPKAPPHPSLAFWRDLASRYLTRLCRTPELTADGLDPIEPPSEAELGGRLLSVPPMVGAEYLSLDTVRAVWRGLDDWVHREVERSDGSHVIMRIERSEGPLVLTARFGEQHSEVDVDHLEPGRSQRLSGLEPDLEQLWRLGPSLGQQGGEFRFADPARTVGDAYHVRVAWEDGTMVWTSPVRVTEVGTR